MIHGVNIVNTERMEEKKNRLALSLRDNLSKRKNQKKSRIVLDKTDDEKKTQQK